MQTKELIAQGIGLVAMCFTISSYQGKSQKTVVGLLTAGSVLFFVNFLMLGATVGAMLNLLGAVRGLVFFYREKLKADRLPWLLGFSAAYFAVYVLTFTVFGTEPTAKNLLIELLPVVGMQALNIGYACKSAAAIRRFGLISSPSWLIYNIAVVSWGAILCETITLASILIGILRLDRKKS